MKTGSSDRAAAGAGEEDGDAGDKPDVLLADFALRFCDFMRELLAGARWRKPDCSLHPALRLAAGRHGNLRQTAAPQWSGASGIPAATGGRCRARWQRQFARPHGSGIEKYLD